jgi:uncharacterized membrane protein
MRVATPWGSAVCLLAVCMVVVGTVIWVAIAAANESVRRRMGTVGSTEHAPRGWTRDGEGGVE